MQSSAGNEYLIHKVVFSQPAFLFDNTVALDTADGMFHPHPKGREIAVQFFLFLGHLLCPGLFLWLTDTPPFRAVPLIAAVLPKDTALWDAVVVVCYAFVMGASVGLTNKIRQSMVVTTAFLTVCFFFLPL